jgi:hypothetical protein
MPFSGSTFTGVAGSTSAAPGQTVQSAVWNNINTDLATALTMLMSQLVSEITNRNALWMNGGLEVWQRGAGSNASFTIATTATATYAYNYTADRWYLGNTANEGSVVSATTGLTNQSQLCAKIQKTAAETGTGAMYFAYPLDTDEIFRLRGNKVSFTATVQAGANWSPASGTLTVNLYVGTGAVGKRGNTAYTGETTALTIATNLTAGGSVTTITGNSSAIIPVTTTQAELQFTWTPVGAAGASDFILIDDVSIESQLSASTWTPQNFDRLDFPIMLKGCKRFYQKTFPYGTAPANAANVSQNALAVAAVATQRLWVNWEYPIELRATGTVTTYIPYTGSSNNWYDFTASVSVAATTTFAGTKGVFITSTTSGSTTNDYCMIHAQTDAGI